MSINQNSMFYKKTISLSEYFQDLLRYWRITVITVSAALILSIVYSLFIATPLYDSTAKIYITNKQTDSITSSDFSISTYLTNDFSEIITDRFVLDKVAEDINYQYSYSQLENSIHLNTPQNTRIIEITVRTANASDSKMIVDSICRISEANLSELMGLDRITIIREGNLPKSPSSPKIENNIFLALILSLALSLLTVFIIHITNNKITSSEDVEKYLGINILSTIPYNSNKLSSKK